MSAVGFTETEFVNCPPLAQVKLVAPFAVKVVELPEQMAVLPVTDKPGRFNTVTVEVAEPVQVPALPLMVYTVVEAGVTFKVLVCAPESQV